jgi:hypothetical protein
MDTYWIRAFFPGGGVLEADGMGIEWLAIGRDGGWDDNKAEVN